MNWSTSGVLAVIVISGCLVSCARQKAVVVSVPIPTVSYDSAPLPEQTQPRNGIYLDRVKVYDEAALEGLLNTAKTNLAQLNGFDQTSLISHLGAIQGSTATQSQNALQITGPPQWGGATPTSPNTPNNPTLPVPSATYTLPSTFQTSAGDFLNEQMQLSMQMINLQLLLSGSLNDQFEQGSNSARIRTTLGFPINISVPPGFKYQGAVAEVEVSICAPANTAKGLTLVTLLPQEKTYNVASLVSKASSIGGGVVAGVVNVGGGVLRSRQTYYLVQDQDTLAVQRFPQNRCASTNPQDPGHSTKPLTFAWQFRPVLGQKVVRDGLRQTFAQISFAQGLNETLVDLPPCAIPVMVRTGWRHYDPNTGRVGTAIDPFESHILEADRFDIPPSPYWVGASDNGDGTVTVRAKGTFKAGTRVRVGGVVQDNTVPGFEQNQRYLRFTAPALSLAIHHAYLLNQDGTEAEVADNPRMGPQCRLSPLPPVPTLAPAIISIGVSGAREGESIAGVLIEGAGTHFTRARPAVTFSTPGISVSRTAVVDDTHLTVSLAIAPTAGAGPSIVQVVSGAESATGTGLFTVQGVARVEPFNDSTSLVTLYLPVPPADHAYTPNELEVVAIGSHAFGLRDAPFYYRSDNRVSVLITNDLIRANRQILWKHLFTSYSETYEIPFPPPEPTGISDFAVTGVTLISYTAGSAVSGSPGASVASNVVVSTASETATGPSLFTIGNGIPGIASVSQASAQPGETLRQVVITGEFTHFMRATPTVTLSNPGVVVGNVSVLDDTHLGADFTVTPLASKVASNITVKTGSEVAVGVGLFAVGSGAALITSVIPASGDRSQVVNVTITGTSSRFVQGQSTVKLSKAGVEASNIAVIDATHLTTTFTIAANAVPGSSTVTVVTGSDKAVGTSSFTVAPRLPSIASVTPAAGQQGQTISGVTITGTFTHFTQGPPAVTFSNPAVTATNVVVSDDTHLTATLNIGANAAAAASTVSDTSNASPKATNTYAIVGSRLSGLRILVPTGVPINEPRADTLVTFSLTDDQAKAYKSIVVQHNTDQPIVVALPAPPAATAASSTPAPKPSCKKPATGIPIGTPSVTLAGTGMSQVVDVRYLDAPLLWTSSSDTSLTIQQLPTLVPPGIEVTFVLGDRSMVSCFVPVQAPGAN
jgi:hypothetical protein